MRRKRRFFFSIRRVFRSRWRWIFLAGFFIFCTFFHPRTKGARVVGDGSFTINTHIIYIHVQGISCRQRSEYTFCCCRKSLIPRALPEGDTRCTWRGPDALKKKIIKNVWNLRATPEKYVRTGCAKSIRRVQRLFFPSIVFRF